MKRISDRGVRTPFAYVAGTALEVRATEVTIEALTSNS
jgi:hypothetical protein